MLENIRRVDNPLTIVALFAGITEVAAAVALPFLAIDVQKLFVWFLIIFPFFLVALFFVILNWNPKALYAPGDYRDDKHFLAALSISSTPTEIRVTEFTPSDAKMAQLSIAATDSNKPARLRGITERHLKTANTFAQHFQPLAAKLFEAKHIESWQFGIHGDGLFLLSSVLTSRRTGESGPVESHIIRTHELSDGQVELSIVGADYKTTDPLQFARSIFGFIEATAKGYKGNERQTG